MAIGAGMQHLRQRTFDGTIGLEANRHGKLLSSDVVIMTEGYHADWLPIVAPICATTRLAHIFCTVANLKFEQPQLDSVYVCAYNSMQTSEPARAINDGL